MEKNRVFSVTDSEEISSCYFVEELQRIVFCSGYVHSMFASFIGASSVYNLGTRSKA